MTMKNGKLIEVLDRIESLLRLNLYVIDWNSESQSSIIVCAANSQNPEFLKMSEQIRKDMLQSNYLKNFVIDPKK